MMDETERGYLSDPLTGDFTAKVTRIEDGGGDTQKVWLDSTLFYPESGGQPDDRGSLGGFRVVAVRDEEGVCHYVKGGLEIGDEINGHVDMARRFDHMQQHTGQHVLSRVFLSLGGLMTVGFHLGEKASTIDLSGTVPEETIYKAEREANAIVYQDLDVKARTVTREEYESGIESGDGTRSRLPEGVRSVRIVEIEDTDSSTCCGTHCLSTGMIGIIKITGTEKVRGGTRVEFLCGSRALGDYGEKHSVLTAVSGALSTDWRELESITGKLVAENKSLRKENGALSRELAGYRAAEIGKPTGEIAGYGLVRKIFDPGDPGEAREMAMRIRDSGEKIVLFGIASPGPGLVFACSPSIKADMAAALSEASAVTGGKGGGGGDFAQGGGGDPSRIEEALDAAERTLREMLE